MTSFVDAFFLLGLAASATLPVAGLLVGKRFSGEESNEYLTQVREESRNLEQKIVEVLGTDTPRASKSHVAQLASKIDRYRQALESQRAARESLEQKLQGAQTDVVNREAAHQELKTAKREDEVILQEVVANYHDISTESVSLERRLADSLKTIDKMTSEVALTADQKAVFEALSTALTTASTQLRDVIVAYQNVYERLAALQGQYTDLENEYIKLVELQLSA
jgi:hypothetical protein